MMFSPQNNALLREAGIASEMLGEGLTTLRKADMNRSGLYNKAFFSLSIGLERLGKLIYILDHLHTHAGQFPSNADLKQLGHDIAVLFPHMMEIRQRHPIDRPEEAFPDSDITRAIITFLSKFGKSTRYYNLDHITGKNTIHDDDPLNAWFSTVGNLVLAKHYSNRQKAKDQLVAANREAAIGDHCAVFLSTEQGRPLTNIYDMIAHAAKVAVIQKWGTFHTATIVRFLCFIIDDLNVKIMSESHDFPFIYEFFYPFIMDDAMLKSRKTFYPDA
ncbi:MAG: hypothetical protein HQL89_15300 [Magnetococcales bacterium]|nr:hypothetical protein [Magnetococcales bacterium]